MIVLHVRTDAEQVYTRLGFHAFIAGTDDEKYATDLSNAWQAAREHPGTRSGVNLDEYVVVFTGPEGEGAIVMLGNLFEGYTFHGPFEDFDAAAAWAEGQDSESVVCTLRNVNEEGDQS